jgi:RND family efflux transporter MFP subunit
MSQLQRRGRHSWLTWTVGASVAAGFAGYAYGLSSIQPIPISDRDSLPGHAGPIAPTRTVPPSVSDITESISAYGRIVPQPGQPRVVSLPFGAMVTRVLVSTGEHVNLGTPLAELEPTRASRLRLQQAREDVSTAEKQLYHLEQKFAAHFATNSQILEAQHALQTARLRKQSLEQEGVGAPIQLKARFAGVVTRVAVREGETAAPGTSLVEIAADDRFEARLSFAEDEIGYVHPGQSVQLNSLDRNPAESLAGRVRLVTSEIDPKSHRIAVYVTLPPGKELTLCDAVRGTLAVTAKTAFVVPSEAVLSSNEGHAIFTVEHGHAIKHLVRIGLRTNKKIAVLGGQLTAGERVVVTGKDKL